MGYLARKKDPPPRTLQYDYTYGRILVLGGGAVSYERGTPVGHAPFSKGPARHLLQDTISRKMAFGSNPDEY